MLNLTHKKKKADYVLHYYIMYWTISFSVYLFSSDIKIPWNYKGFVFGFTFVMQTVSIVNKVNNLFLLNNNFLIKLLQNLLLIAKKTWHKI